MPQDMPSAKGLYEAWKPDRACALDEAHASADLTIPALFPDTSDIHDKQTARRLEKPFQSLGARGVNGLASKLMLALFPPTSPFVKYVVSGDAADRLSEVDETTQSEVASKLAVRERRIQDTVDASNLRTKAYEILRHVLVGGNKALHYDKVKARLRTWDLASYVARWDDADNLLDLIVVEALDRRSITDVNVRAAMEQLPPDEQPSNHERPVYVYTHVRRVEGKKFEECQWVEDVMVPNTRRNYTEGKNLPWIVLAPNRLNGENYGRGFVEEYRGDLTSLEQLSRDRQFLSANMAKTHPRIRPGAAVTPTDWNRLDNGQAFYAEEGDVEYLSVDKGSDASWVRANIEDLKADLSAAFLLNSSFQRHQERVTAEEIRRMAEELDDTLGGLFSMLSQTLQLPLAHLVADGLDMPALPEGDVKIAVVTGLAAIGRGQDLNRLREALAIIADLAGAIPDIFEYISVDELVRRILTDTGVPSEGLKLDKETVEANMQQKQQAASMQQLGTDLSGGAGKAAGNLPPEQVMAILAQASQQGGASTQ